MSLSISTFNDGFDGQPAHTNAIMDANKLDEKYIITLKTDAYGCRNPMSGPTGGHWDCGMDH